jgi:four helix bundle protein
MLPRMAYEQMRVHQAAEKLDNEVLRLIRLVGRGFSDDLKQLRRAIASVLFNIAEGYGSEQIGKKQNHLEIAKGSSDEVRAILQRLVRTKALKREDIYLASSLSRTVCKMLASWIASLQSRE